MYHKRFASRILRIGCSLFAVLILIIALASAQRVPLHQRVLVQGIGIDRTDTNWKVTVQATATNAGASVEVYQAEGGSVSQALQHISRVSGKSPFFTHNSMIVFGRSCAETGLEQCLDFFIRHHQTRPAEAVFLAEDTAEALLTMKSPPQITAEDQTLEVNAYVLANQIQQLASGDRNSNLLEIHILDLANALISEGADPMMPILGKNEDAIAIKGCAVFSGDSLTAILDPEETTALKAVLNRLEDSAVTVPLNQSAATMDVLSSNCTITAEITNDAPHFDLELHCKCNLDAIDRALDQPFTHEERLQLQQQTAQYLQNRIESILQKTLQKEQVDILDLSGVLQRSHTAWWKAHYTEWRALLPQITYSVAVDAEIITGGQEMSPETF